jgi:hypothetical protein
MAPRSQAVMSWEQEPATAAWRCLRRGLSQRGRGQRGLGQRGLRWRAVERLEPELAKRLGPRPALKAEPSAGVSLGSNLKAGTDQDLAATHRPRVPRPPPKERRPYHQPKPIVAFTPPDQSRHVGAAKPFIKRPGRLSRSRCVGAGNRCRLSHGFKRGEEDARRDHRDAESVVRLELLVQEQNRQNTAKQRHQMG